MEQPAPKLRVHLEIIEFEQEPGIGAARTDTVAFLDGPVVLAGLCQEERTLYGDCENPVSLLVPRYERRWQEWTGYWKTTDQPVNINFIPLYQIGNQPYTVYFPIQPKSKV